MKNKPKVKLRLSTVDKLLEAVSLIILLIIWGIVFFNYSNLPQTIPTHYNASGQADAFGGKEEIWKPLIVLTILFIVLTFFNKFPQLFNYPVDITEDNAFRNYTIATRLLRHLKLIIVLIFGYLILQSIQNAELGNWTLLVVLGLIICTIIFSLSKFKK